MPAAELQEVGQGAKVASGGTKVTVGTEVGVGESAVVGGVEVKPAVPEVAGAAEVRTTGVAGDPRNELAEMDDVLFKPLGRGESGRVIANNFQEQLAMKEVMSHPMGKEVPGMTMTDSRWPAKDGWVKMQQLVKNKDALGKPITINVHYVYNERLNLFDDFKFKYK